MLKSYITLFLSLRIDVLEFSLKTPIVNYINLIQN
jgi:hypothetical protein